jgi:branched-chain amino acid transport system permease protein
MSSALLWLGGGALLLLPPFFLDPFGIGLAAQILVFGLLALSVDLLMRHAGMFSMCHGAFFAVAAYATAALHVHHGLPTAVAAPGGIAAALLTAAVFGVSVRTGGVYFILVTLALGQLVWSLTVSWTGLTGGDNGITDVPAPAIGGLRAATPAAYYYLVLGLVVLCCLAYRRLIASPFGLALHGVRDSEARMRALGYDVTALRYVAFVVSGGMAGIAGVLYVYGNQFVSPATANLSVSVEAALMAILGGAGTILGPFIGSAIIIGIRNTLSNIVPGWPILLGLVFIATVLWAPRGVIGLLQRSRAAAPARGSAKPQEGSA